MEPTVAKTPLKRSHLIKVRRVVSIGYKIPMKGSRKNTGGGQDPEILT